MRGDAFALAPPHPNPLPLWGRGGHQESEMTASGNTTVEIEGVTKVYRQGKIDVHALRGLDFEVKAGEFTAICGPSGSGKTTTLNLIGALKLKNLQG